MGKKKPLEIDMIAGSQLRDTQGEMLSVEGADISDLLAGRGRFNDNHGKGFYNSIGRVTFAKKVFKSEDADSDREKYYWEKVKAPFIYVKGYLYDDEDHPNARAAAAILRNVHKADAPLKIKASVEGGVISRGVSDQSLLARTKIHSVALTFTPANNATLVEPTSLDKSTFDEAADMELIKSVAHLAETNVPSFRHITRHASAGKILNNIEIIKEMAAELGISEEDLPFPSKDELIKQAVEIKIFKNVNKINELIKGSRQKKLPYNPNDVTLGDRRKVHNWVSNTSGDDPNDIPRMEGNMRTRAVSKLHGRTKSRVNPKTKELEFLLHRGVSPEDAKDSIKDNIYHNTNQKKSAWTWDPKVATGFSTFINGGGKSVSAWVPEKHIHHMPSMIGDTAGTTSSDKAHQNLFKPEIKASPKVAKPTPAGNSMWGENEIVVNSNPYAIHEVKDTPIDMEAFTPPDLNKGSTKRFPVKKVSNNIKKINELMYELAKAEQLYHIHKDGFKITKEPVTLQHVNNRYGSVKKLESSGHMLVPHKEGIKKALMAGYGGAGAPTSAAGGAVIQSESLEDGRNFKFISCDNCGKEQVYHKHQVKCRECGQSFPLEKLVNLISK